MRIAIRSSSGLAATLLVLAGLAPAAADAVPLYARQTGQNCLACHAGGQFPELTAYGRWFKLTGYTIGVRDLVPLSVMAVASAAKVESHAGTDDPAAAFPRDGQVDVTTASVFCCGRITNNLGAFVQWTYDIYDHQDERGRWRGLWHPDQFDLRWADHRVAGRHEFAWGASLNNNPGVTDVWNTFNSAFTPVPTYVPVAHALASAVPFDVAASPIDQALGQQVGGVTAYAFIDRWLYVEAGAYRAGDGALSFFNNRIDGAFVRLDGTAPYWRVAVEHAWGAHDLTIGAHGFTARTWSDSADRSSPRGRFQDVGVDGQYQWIADPYTFTAMVSYTRERQHYDSALWDPNDPAYVGAVEHATDTLDYWRAKATWTASARYGVALAFTSVSGSPDALLYGSNDSARPDSRLWIPEAFWNPVQNIRVGVQWYRWQKYLGTSGEYDPANSPGRRARDNNSLFVYAWVAY
jgi:hypothetical protein